MHLYKHSKVLFQSILQVASSTQLVLAIVSGVLLKPSVIVLAPNGPDVSPAGACSKARPCSLVRKEPVPACTSRSDTMTSLLKGHRAQAPPAYSCL